MMPTHIPRCVPLCTIMLHIFDLFDQDGELSKPLLKLLGLLEQSV